MVSKLKIFFTFLIIILFNQSQIFTQEINSVEHPEWSYNKIIYEVNLRQYTKEGTFNAFEKHLSKLKELGVGILWFMPIHPIGEKNRKGTLGSYYSVKDYKDVNPEYGTLEDFKSLVDKIHESGMYVIIDWVANHTSWDNVWMKDHPDFYTKDSAGNNIPPVADWADVIDLNFDNMELRSAMMDAMKFWVEEYDIDGYRCDVAGMVPMDFWLDVKEELDKIKPVFMLAEAWEPEHHQAFDMTYSWEIHHLMGDIAKGKKNANDLKTRIEKENEMYPETAYRMQFTSNHDENTWKGTVYEKYGDGAEAFAVLTFMIPGMPLIYNGQEAGLSKRLQFFEKDPIEWKDDKFKDLYIKLIELKKENEALFSGEKGGEIKWLTVNDNIFSFIREKNGEKIVAVFNLSGKENSVELESTLIEGDYKEFNSGKENEFNSSASYNLKPWEYKIFYKN